MTDAWQQQRDNVLDTAGRLAEALAAAALPQRGEGAALPSETHFAAVVESLAEYEDAQFGGFGTAPKFPVAPVLGFLLDRRDLGDERAGSLAGRTLDAMAGSELRDPVEGGFFRYATRRDWSDPHYERMLYDNALLLDCYARAGDAIVAEGIAAFLLSVLRLPSGGFASAQDSESTVDGARVEGGYYRLDAAARASQTPPALDGKVLTGWNGLAIASLASAGRALGHPDWVEAAAVAADLVAAEFIASGRLVRARIGDRVSEARPTLEDYGMLAAGLLELALATGEVRFARVARDLVFATLAGAEPAKSGSATAGFGVPGGADPVLVANGLALDNDPSEGAYPSGISAISRAALGLDALGAGGPFRAAAIAALAPLWPFAVERPISFGGALSGLSTASAVLRQLVVVTEHPDDELASLARAWRGGLVVIVTPTQATAFVEAGFELFDGRGLIRGGPAAYLCENFLCRLPVTTAPDLAALLG